MPAAENPDERRGGRPHAALFWTGVGLAPLDALLVFAGSGTMVLRLAVVLAIIAVVLIGLSVMLRPEPEPRADLEETLYQELDGLRAAVREDITSAARATHASFGEQLRAMREQVEALRGQLESVRGALGQQEAGIGPVPQSATAPAPRPVGTAMVGGGVVRHTETVQVTTRQTIVDPNGGDDRGRVYGAGPRYAHRAEDPMEAPPMRHGGRDGWHEPDRRDGWQEPDGREGWPERGGRDDQQERGWRGGDRAERGPERGDRLERGARLERDEWVAPREESWTEPRLRETGGQSFDDPGRFTRSSYDAPNGHDAPNGYDVPAGRDARIAYGHPGGYGYPSASQSGAGGRDYSSASQSGAGGRDYSSASQSGASDEPAVDTGGWIEERRDPGESYGRGGYGPPARSRHRGDSGQDEVADAGDDPRWSSLRAGDRWASMHSDERGRELRMGERRAAIRNDESGTELRIEDRWAAVRREEATRGEGRRGQRDEPRRERRGREEGWGGGDQDDWPGVLSAGQAGPAALPAEEYAPEWSRGWREEPGGTHQERERERDDWWAGEEPSRRGGGRRRQPDYELSDDRWR